ncbi:MAG: histidine-type phosphatase [Sodalis sp. (in: enterobacteria)]|uniref:histidine-type phosphatase n=1 Tax=Sodalis sp. (in: enterobacteria) TaxID=1898979 RepID=UPI003F2C13E7
MSDTTSRNGWLAQNHLFGKHGYPEGGEVFAYANSPPRTIDTAKFFLDGAFPGCGISVNHQAAVGTMDPTFNPIITAAVTEDFKTAALNSIAEHAGPGGVDGLNARLKPNYQLLEQALDYPQSQACQRDKRCSLATQTSSVVLEQGKEPAISGPLRTGIGASNAFMLQYYEGFPLRDAGWGKITTAAQWRQLEAIKNLYHETLFGSPSIAANAAKPLLTFIAGALNAQPAQGARQHAAQHAVLTLLAGHDSNIASLLAAMKVRNYQLPDQFERTPISAAIVFQRWDDDKQNRDLMKIEYVYPTSREIRNDRALSLASPPRRVTLVIEGCPLDVAGFYPMSDFKRAVMRDFQG